ncbi:MAG: hypothetical protein IKV48_08610, partial [Eggerthellaceae bacterium]|nr:hypothetical protein [Eggerthellaceae bacterium]
MGSSGVWKIVAGVLTLALLAVVGCGAYLLMGGFGNSGFGSDLPLEETAKQEAFVVGDYVFEGPMAGLLPAKL